MKPQNLPETLIWYYIIGTYGFFILGAQFIVAPLLAYFLMGYLVLQWWRQTPETPAPKRIKISSTTWVWVVCMLMIEVALIMGHLDYNLGLFQIIKSSVNEWLRKWALFPVFLLISHLKIRPQLIYRAICILCLQCLIIIPFVYLAVLIHFPTHFYTSPLEPLGGATAHYEVVLMDEFQAGQEIRLELFAPWETALGLLGNIYFLLTLQEQNKRWRWIGVAGAVAMTVLSVSRLAVLCLPFTIVSVWLLTNFYRPWVQITAGLGSFLSGILAPILINWGSAFWSQFHSFRASSSRVRLILVRMTLYRWRNEAPIWGHGIGDSRGPAITKHMPLGSHHTWFSLLFTHGIVGCIAFAVAMIWSFIDLVIKAQNYQLAKVGLSILLVILVFTISEKVNTLAYLYWPGLIIIGKAFQVSNGEWEMGHRE